MIFRYQLTKDQFQRFVLDPETTAEINLQSKLIGVKVEEHACFLDNAVTQWTFGGTCEGGAALFRFCEGVTERYEIIIRVDKAPWYLPRFVLDIGFRKALV
jgi:hypothetical protein